MTEGRWFLVLGAIGGATAVLAGALGSHALSEALDEHALELFRTAANYQLIHSVVLCLIGVWWQRGDGGKALNLAGWAMVAGIVAFCGSLYVLALGGPRAIGPATPLGGTAFIVGWVSLAVAAVNR